MPVFRYQALNESGQKVHGVLNAPNEVTARARVREQGLFPTSLEVGPESRLALPSFGKPVGDRDLAATTRLLATLLAAGFSVVEALSTLSNQSASPHMAQIVRDVRNRVEEGGRLSSGLEAHPEVFPELYIQMVRAGEGSAALFEVLSELADYLEVRSKVRDKLQAALAYPAIMTVVGLGMLAFLVAWVVPTMAELLRSGGRDLPLITTILMFLGDILLGYWWSFPFLGFGGYTALRMYLATESGRDNYHWFLLRAPGLGNLNLKMSMARFSRLFGVLLQAGVPVLQALEIVRGVVDNIHIARVLEQARTEVAKGASISDPLRASGLFPPLVVDMIAAGQRAGKLTETLHRLAEGYDSEVESAIETFMALLEPMLILIMAVAVSFVVAGVLLPIFEMNNLRGF
jgi:general secretion pathway protein F